MSWCVINHINRPHINQEVLQTWGKPSSISMHTAWCPNQISDTFYSGVEAFIKDYLPRMNDQDVRYNRFIFQFHFLFITYRDHIWLSLTSGSLTHLAKAVCHSFLLRQKTVWSPNQTSDIMLLFRNVDFLKGHSPGTNLHSILLH